MIGALRRTLEHQPRQVEGRNPFDPQARQGFRALKTLDGAAGQHGLPLDPERAQDFLAAGRVADRVARGRSVEGWVNADNRHRREPAGEQEREASVQSPTTAALHAGAFHVGAAVGLVFVLLSSAGRERPTQAFDYFNFPTEEMVPTSMKLPEAFAGPVNATSPS